MIFLMLLACTEIEPTENTLNKDGDGFTNVASGKEFLKWENGGKKYYHDMGKDTMSI